MQFRKHGIYALIGSLALVGSLTAGGFWAYNKYTGPRRVYRGNYKGNPVTVKMWKDRTTVYIDEGDSELFGEYRENRNRYDKIECRKKGIKQEVDPAIKVLLRWELNRAKDEAEMFGKEDD